jgi:Bacterial mobilisation protein (MobC)
MAAGKTKGGELKKSRSETRQRPKGVCVRFNESEFLDVESRADGAGLSNAAYLRACALGSAGPRAKRSPTVERKLAAQAIAELNKAGSNLNQIARAVNMALSPAAPEITAAAAAVKKAARQIIRAFGHKTHDSEG